MAEQQMEVTVPDIGDFKDVPVIEVLVKPGDAVKKNDSLVTLESEKASMEIPSTADGTVAEVKVKVGDRVSQGSIVVTLSGGAAAPPQEAREEESNVIPSRDAQSASRVEGQPSDPERAKRDVGESRSTQPVTTSATPTTNGVIHASPSTRRFARELGVDLHTVRGSGPNGRVTREDVQNFVKSSLQTGGGGGATFAGLPAWPKVDFAQYGPIESRPLSRIKKLSGPNLHRNWLQIPHITNYDEADVTDLEAFRNEINAAQSKSVGPKLTILAFLVKASIAALKKFPDFNASLDGENLVVKNYYNIGFAADTPNGLVVPVIKNADTLGLLDIAKTSSELAAKARDGKISLGEMQGGTFTISSIGGIGGTQFTQIVNAPEVAILGATKAQMKPVWDGKQFVPRLILPVSVSYDHRVIDGASAARFLSYLTSVLNDFRKAML